MIYEDPPLPMPLPFSCMAATLLATQPMMMTMASSSSSSICHRQVQPPHPQNPNKDTWKLQHQTVDLSGLLRKMSLKRSLSTSLLSSPLGQMVVVQSESLKLLHSTLHVRTEDGTTATLKIAENDDCHKEIAFCADSRQDNDDDEEEDANDDDDSTSDAEFELFKNDLANLLPAASACWVAANHHRNGVVKRSVSTNHTATNSNNNVPRCTRSCCVIPPQLLRDGCVVVGDARFDPRMLLLPLRHRVRVQKSHHVDHTNQIPPLPTNRYYASSSSSSNAADTAATSIIRSPSNSSVRLNKGAWPLDSFSVTWNVPPPRMVQNATSYSSLRNNHENNHNNSSSSSFSSSSSSSLIWTRLEHMVERSLADMEHFLRASAGAPHQNQNHPPQRQLQNHHHDDDVQRPRQNHDPTRPSSSSDTHPLPVGPVMVNDAIINWTAELHPQQQQEHHHRRTRQRRRPSRKRPWHKMTQMCQMG